MARHVALAIMPRSRRTRKLFCQLGALARHLAATLQSCPEVPMWEVRKLRMESGSGERNWRVEGSVLRPGLDVPTLRGEGRAGLWVDADMGDRGPDASGEVSIAVFRGVLEL